MPGGTRASRTSESCGRGDASPEGVGDLELERRGRKRKRPRGAPPASSKRRRVAVALASPSPASSDLASASWKAVPRRPRSRGIKHGGGSGDTPSRGLFVMLSLPVEDIPSPMETAASTSCGSGKKPIRKRGGRSCHQCKKVRKQPQELIQCERCSETIYCSPCIRKKYPEMSLAEVRALCPLCRQICNCIRCESKSPVLRKSKSSISVIRKEKADSSGVKSTRIHNEEGPTNKPVTPNKVDTLDVRAEVDAETKRKYARYLLHYLVPHLTIMNKEHMAKREIEARIQGLELSDMNVEQAVWEKNERAYCDNCRTSIFDLHRRCPNCLYELCIVCCKELRGGHLHGSCREELVSYPNRGFDYMHGGDPLPEVVNHEKTDFPICQSKTTKWHANPAGVIRCPPIELGGCGNDILELRQMFPKIG